MGATGLAANPTEYRDRLGEQSDEQLDAWTAELLRDVAKRPTFERAPIWTSKASDASLRAAAVPLRRLVPMPPGT